MLTRIKDTISRLAQRALGIDSLRFNQDIINSKLDVISSKLDIADSKLDASSSKLDAASSKLEVAGSKLEVITDKLVQYDPKLQNLMERGDTLFWQTRQVSDSLDRLRSFLTWSANRVEPWLPAENFSQTEADYDFAGFLYNFLPNRVAVDVGASDSEFAKALSGIGYQVFCIAATAEAFEQLRNETINLPRVEIFDFMTEATGRLAESIPTNAGSMHPREGVTPKERQVTTIAYLLSSGILPPQIDLMKIGTDHTDLETTKGLASVRPAVIQIEFSSENLAKQRTDQIPVVSASEKIKVMHELEYYWNIIIFRVDSEDFVRMATNLGGTPKQSWGKIFFFQDYQLFLKAHHWCKGALPRFRSGALPSP